MSLVGNLEDLGLAEIFQIAGISRKSGVLQLRSGDQVVRIFFDAGQIRGALQEGEVPDLGRYAVEQELLSEAALQQMLEATGAVGRDVGRALIELGCVDTAGLERLLRCHLDAVITRAFGWESGEFSFDIGGLQPDVPETELLLEEGLNPQFLALEAARRLDELGKGAALEPAVAADDAVGRQEPPALGTPEAAVREDAPAAKTRSLPVVAVDPDLATLEWIKRALEPIGARVHILQRSDQAVARIRQYLLRGEAAIALLTDATPPDPVSGASDWVAIAARLRAQVPTQLVLLLAPEAQKPADLPADSQPEGVAERPSPTVLSDPRAESQRVDLADKLRVALATIQGIEPVRLSPDPWRAKWEGVREQLRHAPSRSAVWTGILDFAAEGFERTALFTIEDEEAIGVGARVRREPDDVRDPGLRDTTFAVEESSWLRKVVETRCVLRAAPSDEGDRALFHRLGGESPDEAYLAPIERCGTLVAVLYGDNAIRRGTVPDTRPLEPVLKEAGLALERLPATQ